MFQSNILLKKAKTLFVLLLSLSALPIGYAQGDQCNTIDCNKIFLEAIREEANVSTGCPGGAGISCEDKFRQIAYKIYLKAELPASTSYNSFFLDYQMLDVSVKLGGSPIYSYIDVAATNACFQTGVGAGWYNYNNTDGDKVIFSTTEKLASISFANLSSNDGCGSSGANGTGNRIKLESVPPANVAGCSFGKKCFYVQLFTVIVNAYPGEASFVQFDLKRYLPKSGISQCDPIPIVPNGSKNGIISVTVNSPTDYIGTANENIVAELREELGEAVIRLRNVGTSTIGVTYVEFLLEAALENLDPVNPLSFTGAIPRVYLQPAIGALQTGILHYQVPLTEMLAPGASKDIGRISITTPIISNLSWNASFQFKDSGTNQPARSRIKTMNTCTTLKVGNGITITDPGDNLCAANEVDFFIEGVAGTNCTTAGLRVGLRSTSPPSTKKLTKVDFQLRVVWSVPGTTATGSVDYTNWPAQNICTTNGCFTVGGATTCSQFSQNATVFDYCYETTDLNAIAYSLNTQQSMMLTFNVPNGGCITKVEVLRLKVIYAGTDYLTCVPHVVNGVTGFPACPDINSMISGALKTETGSAVKEVSVEITTNTNCMPACTDEDESGTSGDFQFFCGTCNQCNLFDIKPVKDDNPLNGVTTYDLVLINKHTLGIAPLGSPYKMIAADANKSNSITTFDIVEFRKLILGVYSSLPNNKSWRFVPESYSFQHPGNPFNDSPHFPETLINVPYPSSGQDFIAIKVGDVNNTVILDKPLERPQTLVSWPALKPTKGSVITIPVTYTGAQALDAIQLGLRFDTAQLQLIGPSLGDLPSFNEGCFNLLDISRGDLRTVWLSLSDPLEKIQPGQVLFYLSFNVLNDITGKFPLDLSDKLLEGLAWNTAGTEHKLLQQPAVATAVKTPDTPGLKVAVYPNPTSSDMVLDLEMKVAEPLRIGLYDAFGREIAYKEVATTAGRQTIRVPELASQPAGVYRWKAYTKRAEAQGTIIKQ